MGKLVEHTEYGKGRVQAELGETVLVRFDHGIESCDPAQLIEIVSPESSLEQNLEAPPQEVVLRLLAYALQSCNDTWGVFAPSKIDLLPHQLWVCRKVLESYPFRWLVADDVGLGKTIEAGLILWPLIARKVVKRLLVIAPASLVEQWQERMRIMFDIRLTVYHPIADTEKQAFWETQSMVAASLHTLRDDHKGRHERLLSSEKWDLVIVDEAHHVNFDEQAGKTQNYLLLEKLVSPENADSVLFFTGTPHRGKHHNFFALMKLLRSDLFDPNASHPDQMKNLHQVMIRNNKQTVTDLTGKKIFQEPMVDSRTYRYSDEEAEFYNKLTQFILTGKAYASSLGQSEGQAVILVLIVMQKLASSSVSAIRRTLRNRLDMIRKEKKKFIERTQSLPSPQAENEDEKNQADEALLSKVLMQLMENEEHALEELLEAAGKVDRETKILEILEYTRLLPPGTSVLFFTEYKATQSMLISALMEEYGQDEVTFINGDRALTEVKMPDGRLSDLRFTREDAADSFNSGKKRFLVSTEAAGEGIDLQENCHHLVHVDLPWNPMRLHQRHGRLNRYGQKHRVKISLFRNPDTLEGQIWDLLAEKIANINASLAASMEEPEDLGPLVLGMAPAGTFDSLYFDSPQSGSLKEWFDAKTSTLGGRDIVDTVQDLIGNSQRFDFQAFSKQIPRLDLKDLSPFFEGMLRLRQRQIRREDEAITFKTPEFWMKVPGITGLQEGIVFRRRPPRNRNWKVAGIGSPVVNQALADASSLKSYLATIESSNLATGEIYVFEVQDKITGSKGNIHKVTCGVRISPPMEMTFLRDADLVELLNSLLQEGELWRTRDDTPSGSLYSSDPIEIETIRRFILKELPKLKLPFEKPEANLTGCLKVVKP